MSNIADKSQLTLKDDQGNQLKIQGNGFVSATCNGIKQDINLLKIAEIGRKIGTMTGNPDAPVQKLKSEPFDILLRSPFDTAVSTTPPATTSGQAAIFEKIGDAVESLKSIKGVRVTLELDTDVSLSSPLTHMCKAGKEAGLIQDSH